MNTVTKSLFFTFMVPGFLIVGIIAYLIITDKERIFSSIPKEYTTLIKSEGDIENRYYKLGNYEPYVMDNSKYGDYKDLLENLYYPKEFITENDPSFPLIVLVTNGFFDTDIKLICNHLVSWGFVVLTVKDSDPVSSQITNAIELLSDLNVEDGFYNEFYYKFNLESIGIIGFDVAIEPIYITIKSIPEYKQKIKTIVSLSPKFNNNNNVLHQETFNIDIPIMVMIPGSGTDFTLRDQRELSDKIIGEKVIARRINAEYTDMIYISTGYVIAWLKFMLYDEDEEFFSELKNNNLYKNCDIRINNYVY